MRSLRFLTWLDVRREILKGVVNRDDFPRKNASISCFSGAIEINLYGDAGSREESRQKIREIFSEIFQDWYQTDLEQIRLDLEDAVLPIEFNQYDAPIEANIEYVHPYWREVVYSNAATRKAALPTESLTDPKLIAFHSFKGGVGRTLHLAAYLSALLETSAKMAEDISILVIDADLEAPGLTYWDRKEKQEPFVSFIDFLEAYHYSPGDREETIKTLANEIKKTPRYVGKSKFYFLPACLNDEQLLDIFVLPEHLARSLDGRWTCGDAIYKLGKALSADYVLIDLRSGLSDISSPMVFDSRIQRFLVTTATEQSIAGTCLILGQIQHLAPSQADVACEKLHDPAVIISFLTPELEQGGAVEIISEKLNSAYRLTGKSNGESPHPTGLNLEATQFSPELLWINSWEEARSKLASTLVMTLAMDWAESELRNHPDFRESGSFQQVLEGV